MEKVTPEQKQPIIKSLAVAGLLGVIIFISWLAIQIVQVFPKAADSLASLANSVYNYNPNEPEDVIELATSQTMVKSGEPFAITWKSPNAKGTYTFSYTCLEGITLDITTSNNNFASVACDQSYELGEDTSIELTIHSNKNRFTEVLYTINFYKTNATTSTGSYAGKVTVVNSNLFAEATAATTTAEIITDTSTSTAATTETKTPPTPVVKPAIATTTVNPPIPPELVYTQPDYIYEIPVSQTDGEADLLVSFISLGSIDKNGTFIKSTTLTTGVTGALQISVHNIGNKTSQDWTFTSTLPGGLEFISDKQKPLLPNERSLLTLQFKAIDELSIHPYSIEVSTTADKNKNNNAISGNALVTNI